MGAKQCGAFVGQASYKKMQACVEYASVPKPTSSQSSVPVKVNFRGRCKGWFYETVTISWSGSLGSGSITKTISFPSNNSEILLHTITVSVPVSYGKTTPLSVSVTVSGVNYIGTSYKPKATGTATIAARPYKKPAKPSSVTATPEGSKWRLKFPSSSTTSAPATKRRVQLSRNGGSYFTLGTTSGTSWLTSQAKVNGRYRCRARAENSSGHSDWAYSSYWETKPAAPSNVTAVKTGLGEVTVNWTNNAPYADEILVRHYQGGVDQGLIATLSGSSTTYLVSGLDSSEMHRFSVAAKTKAGKDFTSDATTSNTVQLDAPPNAPTSLLPNGVAKNADQPISLGWVYNSADSSLQTGYEIGYRLQGTSSWTIVSETSAASSHTLAAGTLTNGEVYEWKARTRAQHPDWGLWSATALLPCSTPPAVTILSPADGDVLGSNQVAVEWAYLDEEGDPQQRAEITLSRDGTVASTVQITDPAIRQAVLPHVLENNAAYQLSVVAVDAAGLYSQPDTVVITTVFTPPPDPLVDVTWATDRAAAEIIISNPSGAVDAVDNLVERSLDGGETWQILGTIPIGATWIDPTPHLIGETRYRVTALSDLPSSSTPVEATIQAREQAAWITYGPDMDQAIAIPYNLDIPSTIKPTGVLHEFAGRPAPVAVRNLTMPHTRTIAVSGVHLGSITEAETIAALTGDIYWRDPAGRRLWAAITDTSIKPDQWGAKVSFKLAEVDHRD